MRIQSAISRVEPVLSQPIPDAKATASEHVPSAVEISNTKSESPETGKKGVIVDVGQALLNAPFESFYVEPEVAPSGSTSFMANLRNLLSSRSTDASAIPQSITKAADSAAAQTSGENSTKSSMAMAASTLFGIDSDNDSGEELAQETRKRRRSESSNSEYYEEPESENDHAEAETDQEQRFNTSAFEESKQDKRVSSMDEVQAETFLPFANIHDSDLEEMLDGDTEDAVPAMSKRERRTYFTRDEAQKRAKMSKEELGVYLDSIVRDLCIIDEIPPWAQHNRTVTSKSDKRNRGCYTDSSFPRILNREIQDFVAYMSPSIPETRIRQFIISEIQTIVTSLWPDAVVNIFGSFETQLHLPTSDVDLVIFTPRGVVGGGLTLHNQLASRLRKANLAKDGKVTIIPARVPIIKFDTTSELGGYQIDISFNLDSGPRASTLIQKFIATLPALRPLVLVLKQFLLSRGLNEVFRGGLGSYGLTALVVSFLQMHPKVQAGEIRGEDNLGVLLIEFLDLMGRRFNYEQVGMKIDGEGCYFRKDAQQSPEYAELTRGNGGGRNSFGRDNGRNFSLTIQDPQDPSNDICRGTFNLRQISLAFARAYSLLTATIFELEDNYFAEQTKKGRNASWDMRSAKSVLASVVQVGRDVVERRRQVAECYEALVRKGIISRDGSVNGSVARINTSKSPSDVGRKNKKRKSDVKQQQNHQAKKMRHRNKKQRKI